VIAGLVVGVWSVRWAFTASPAHEFEAIVQCLPLTPVSRAVAIYIFRRAGCPPAVMFGIVVALFMAIGFAVYGLAVHGE
jgi:hypothetical protein